jgi:hypothetical protein
MVDICTICFALSLNELFKGQQNLQKVLLVAVPNKNTEDGSDNDSGRYA